MKLIRLCAIAWLTNVAELQPRTQSIELIKRQMKKSIKFNALEMLYLIVLEQILVCFGLKPEFQKKSVV